MKKNFKSQQQTHRKKQSKVVKFFFLHNNQFKIKMKNKINCVLLNFTLFRNIFGDTLNKEFFSRSKYWRFSK